MNINILLILSFFTLSFGWLNHFQIKTYSLSSSFLRASKIEVGNVGEIPNGERKIIETSAGAVIVANIDGGYFAVNAKCPHLGLPMKKGAIEKSEDGTPIITCNFHNSKFSLEDGSCKVWCSGVLGLPNTGFIANISGKFGGKENTPATVYPITIEDNKIFVEV